MEEKEIIIHKTVDLYLKELTSTLYREEYFGFLESAEAYVNRIVDEIIKKLPSATHYNTPNALKRYGRYYIKIATNRRTMWYVFFDKKDTRFFVDFITNNHSPDAVYFTQL